MRMTIEELDEKRKIQKELREVERLSFTSKEMQENLMESMQHQLQEEEKRKNDLMLEQQKVQRRSPKYTKHSGQEKTLLKESLAAREEMPKLREEIEWKEERFTLLSDSVDKNTMADAEMEAELQGLQAGEERRGSNASQAVECCAESMVEKIFTIGTDQAMSQFDALYQKILKRFETPTPPAQMP